MKNVKNVKHLFNYIKKSLLHFYCPYCNDWTIKTIYSARFCDIQSIYECKECKREFRLFDYDKNILIELLMLRFVKKRIHKLKIFIFAL